MDASFLTRVLTRLEAKGLVESTPSPTDGRALDLALTDAGRAAYAELDARSAAQIAALVSGLSDEQRRDGGGGDDGDHGADPARCRRPRRSCSGACGRATWAGSSSATAPSTPTSSAGTVTSRRSSRGSSPTTTPASARAASRPGSPRSTGPAPAASSAASGTPRPRSCASSWSSRGRAASGSVPRLVEACTSFAAEAGYDTIVLWTNDVLVSARRIYEAAGFRLVDEERHHSFGHDLVGQHWELVLR